MCYVVMMDPIVDAKRKLSKTVVNTDKESAVAISRRLTRQTSSTMSDKEKARYSLR